MEKTIGEAAREMGVDLDSVCGGRGVCGKCKVKIEDSLRITEQGAEFVIAWADETSVGQDITVWKGDVRAVQLAKGAMYAGAKLMMCRLGVDRLDKVVLAGAFGSYIDKESALTLGLFPAALWRTFFKETREC